MSLLLCVHSWGGANQVVERHWRYFINAKADKIVGVGTEVGDCRWPEGIEEVRIGDGKYMNGPNLPTRLMDTLAWCLTQPFDKFCVSEYDVIFAAAIPDFTGVGGHIAGGRTFNARASYFTHNPWYFDRPSTERLVPEMKAIIDEGWCSYGSCESSPDCFLAYAFERLGMPCQQILTEFSRNSFDIPGDLELARDAYRSGVQCIHGVKSEHELAVITT